MLVPGRHGTDGSYRYGFQGQEMDDEIKGEGNSLNYTFRMHDPRVGRFFAVDPLTAEYPHYTPYSFSGNKVIAHFELEGLEEVYYQNGINNDETLKPALDLMLSTDLGFDVYRKIWSTEGGDDQRDVYITFGSWSNERNTASTYDLKSNDINKKGKVTFALSDNIDDRKKDAIVKQIDFSKSKREGNNVSVIIVNTNSKIFKNAKLNLDGISNVYLSETLYHEFWAHVILKLEPRLFPKDVKGQEQEHYRYHGKYGTTSPNHTEETPGTQRQMYIDEALEIQEQNDEDKKQEKEEKPKN
ncbi:hypothetical protein ULMS_08910 [Patiriisocius marinistellae]|uniref:RHS repeat-associated core domain-containing protein n=2 Tax=Patiriisocius marinistellae TaxID=2494560 RepID=A0A5J4FUC9_9FLAO|nr:hypothetical protein ULMS_08910 [Patiriisocius marinistellae]